MSQQLISRSPQLKRLQEEGFDLEVRANYLLVKGVPYVNSESEVKRGTLVSELTLAGDVATTPGSHVAYFAGGYPCLKDGSEISQIRHSSSDQRLADGLLVNHMFSSKPTTGAYKDYYEKITTYVAIISSPAEALDSNATARTFPLIVPTENESVFNYLDTASSRAGIGVVTSKLQLRRLAIVGVGGTGSYVLDLIAKVPVREIHLYDGDRFSNHNAFRSPGAPSIEELRQEPLKVDYFKERYARMHRHIVAHNYYIDESNVDQLQAMDFVFLCLDRGTDKRLIVDRLEEWAVPFIDVGMGVHLVDDSLLGILRITSSTAKKRAHVKRKNRIPFANGNGDNDYDRNIQIADLNALNATLAVIKWKKLYGFYHDLEQEHHCTYTIDGNMLLNEDLA